MPASLGGPFGGFAALLRCHPLGPRFPALQAAFAAERDSGGILSITGIPVVVDLARGYICDELGELIGIAWALA
jgi:hypothetical protein